MADNPSLFTILRQGVEGINSVTKALNSTFPQTTGTSTSATAGAATLPANPIGFITITLPDGTSAKVPYYG